MIIFDELKYAENLLEREFNGFIRWRDLLILAKYYRSLGKVGIQLEKSILDFCTNKVKGFNEVRNDSKIQSAIRKSKKQPLKISDYVVITKKEIERIRSINDYKIEKILFLMLVVCKINHPKDYVGTHYLNQNFSYLVKLANVYMTKNERNSLKYFLHQKGFLDCPEPNRFNVTYGKESFIILYVDNKSEEYLRVVDFDNIVKYYKPVCEKCGEIIEKNSNRQKMCENCQKEHRKEWDRDRKKKIPLLD